MFSVWPVHCSLQSTAGCLAQACSVAERSTRQCVHRVPQSAEITPATPGRLPGGAAERHGAPADSLRGPGTNSPLATRGITRPAPADLKTRGERPQRPAPVWPSVLHTPAVLALAYQEHGLPPLLVALRLLSVAHDLAAAGLHQDLNVLGLHGALLPLPNELGVALDRRPAAAAPDVLEVQRDLAVRGDLHLLPGAPPRGDPHLGEVRGDEARDDGPGRRVALRVQGGQRRWVQRDTHGGRGGVAHVLHGPEDSVEKLLRLGQRPARTLALLLHALLQARILSLRSPQ